MQVKKRFPLAALISLLLIAVVLAVVVVGVRGAAEANRGEAMRTLEDSLNRAAISCYAIEGAYPPTLDYLSENYGVYIDEESFIVHYEIFASNIMPDITVQPVEGD